MYDTCFSTVVFEHSSGICCINWFFKQRTIGTHDQCIAANHNRLRMEVSYSLRFERCQQHCPLGRISFDHGFFIHRTGNDCKDSADAGK